MVDDAWEQESQEGCTRWEIPDVNSNVDTSAFAPPSAKQLDQIQRDAYEEGFATGYQEGLQRAESEILEKKQQLQVVMDSIAEPMNIIDESIEKELIKIVMTICQRLIGHEYQRDPKLLGQLIKQIKSVLMAPGVELMVYMHPEDIALIAQCLKEHDLHHIELIEQDTLARGACQVKTATADMDASIDTRIHNLLDDYLADLA